MPWHDDLGIHDGLRAEGYPIREIFAQQILEKEIEKKSTFKSKVGSHRVVYLCVQVYIYIHANRFRVKTPTQSPTQLTLEGFPEPSKASKPGQMP